MSLPPPSYVHPGPPPEHPERPEGAPERARRTGLPPWRWWMGVVGVIVGLAIPLVLGVVAGIIVAIAGGDAGDLPSGVLIALTFLQDVGFVIAAIFVARMARHRRRATSASSPRRCGGRPASSRASTSPSTSSPGSGRRS